MECTISEQSIFKLSKEQVACDLAGETVILNFKDSTYYGLDAVGTFIWELIQKSKNVKEIYNSLIENFEVEPENCKNDLITILKDLKAKGLIEVKNETFR